MCPTPATGARSWGLIEALGRPRWNALRDDLPPGEYSVRVGWYSYPEIVNFCVLANGACSTPAAQIGTFRIE